MEKVIVAGIGTDVGKTVVSAIWARAMNADYWKPVQTGSDATADRLELQRLVPGLTIHPERHHYQQPMSPHAAAALEDAAISLTDFELPSAERLVVELAGGLLVPLNDQHTNLDLIERLGLPVVLVSRYYLGSINHTLLSAELLRTRNIPCLGCVMNGEPVPSTREAIVEHSGLPILMDIPTFEVLDGPSIEPYSPTLLHED